MRCLIGNDLKESDYDLYSLIEKEAIRQNDSIELIASENIVDLSILEAQGSILTNKYAEGYPNARYYGGCKFVDAIEELAISRLKKLFSAEWANVQPHSGSQANQAVYAALIKAGDVVLGQSLESGGHLTHGCKANISGSLYKFYQYGTKNARELDYNEIRELAHKHKPKLIVAGFSAYVGKIDYALMREIADEVGAYFMMDMAHIAGLIAGNVLDNPIKYADVVTSTTHKTLRGPRGGIILSGRPELQVPHPFIDGKIVTLASAIDSRVFPGIQGGPLMHVIAAKATCFGNALKGIGSDGWKFGNYAKNVLVNASIMADTFLKRGLTLVGAGTDNHMLLIDLMPLGISGREVQFVLDEAHIAVNKNAVPNDNTPPSITSGIRIGSPAGTTRGFGKDEFRLIADMICDIILDLHEKLGSVSQSVIDSGVVGDKLAIDIRKAHRKAVLDGIASNTIDAIGSKALALARSFPIIS